jgi:hypothetical protein
MSPLDDPIEEARRILKLASAQSFTLRAMGGVAVRLRCPSAARSPLAREYRDIDFAARAGEGGTIAELFSSAGYQPDAEFNALHGRHRLFFWDAQHDREADVFVDSFSMCHAFDFRDRLTIDEDTLPLADLLLFKLQVVETNDKDYKDALALLADHSPEAGSLDAAWIAQFLARDWGWWRTVTMVLGRVESFAAQLEGFDRVDSVLANIAALREEIERVPKTRRWKMRARVGERVRWYEEPEEAHT